jgi:competence protein ComEC
MAHLAFLNVGQGDTIVVSNPRTSEAIVVDCLNPIAVLDFLLSEGVDRVRAVVVTHLHIDHYQGLVTFLEGCQSRGIVWDTLYLNWINGARQLKHLLDDSDQHSQAIEDNHDLQHRKKMDTFKTLTSWARRAGQGRVKRPELLDGFNMSGIKLEFLHPLYNDAGDLELIGLNNVSVVLRVSTEGVSALLTGDLEPLGWDVLGENTPELSCNVLKFPHHGAWKRDDVNALLDSVNPEIVVMSVGTAGQAYGHPNAHVFDALKCRAGIKVLCTQATSQCVSDPTKVEEQVNAVLSDVNGRFNGLAISKGCPCASTVVIDLNNDGVRIIHPPLDVHDRIITEFFPNAQCRKL